jgi:hypothetical protein
MEAHLEEISELIKLVDSHTHIKGGIRMGYYYNSIIKYIVCKGSTEAIITELEDCVYKDIYKDFNGREPTSPTGSDMALNRSDLVKKQAEKWISLHHHDKFFSREQIYDMYKQNMERQSGVKFDGQTPVSPTPQKVTGKGSGFSKTEAKEYNAETVPGTKDLRYMPIKAGDTVSVFSQEMKIWINTQRQHAYFQAFKLMNIDLTKQSLHLVDNGSLSPQTRSQAGTDRGRKYYSVSHLYGVANWNADSVHHSQDEKPTNWNGISFYYDNGISLDGNHRNKFGIFTSYDDGGRLIVVIYDITQQAEYLRKTAGDGDYRFYVFNNANQKSLPTYAEDLPKNTAIRFSPNINPLKSLVDEYVYGCDIYTLQNKVAGRWPPWHGIPYDPKTNKSELIKRGALKFWDDASMVVELLSFEYDGPIIAETHDGNFATWALGWQAEDVSGNEIESHGQRLLSYKPNIARQGSYVSSANFKWFLLGHDKNIEDYFERLFKSSDVSLDKYKDTLIPIFNYLDPFVEQMDQDEEEAIKAIKAGQGDQGEQGEQGELYDKCKKFIENKNANKEIMMNNLKEYIASAKYLKSEWDKFVLSFDANNFNSNILKRINYPTDILSILVLINLSNSNTIEELVLNITNNIEFFGLNQKNGDIRLSTRHSLDPNKDTSKNIEMFCGWIQTLKDLIKGEKEIFNSMKMNFDVYKKVEITLDNESIAKYFHEKLYGNSKHQGILRNFNPVLSSQPMVKSLYLEGISDFPENVEISDKLPGESLDKVRVILQELITEPSTQSQPVYDTDDEGLQELPELTPSSHIKALIEEQALIEEEADNEEDYEKMSSAEPAAEPSVETASGMTKSRAARRLLGEPAAGSAPDTLDTIKEDYGMNFLNIPAGGGGGGTHVPPPPPPPSTSANTGTHVPPPPPPPSTTATANVGEGEGALENIFRQPWAQDIEREVNEGAGGGGDDSMDLGGGSKRKTKRKSKRKKRKTKRKLNKTNKKRKKKRKSKRKSKRRNQ